MKQIISYNLRKIAELLVFAADLDFEKLSHIMQSLRDLFEDKNMEREYFDLTKKEPFTFSKKGLRKIRSIDPGLIEKSLMETIKRIDQAIKISHDETMIALNEYLDNSLRKSSNKWINAKPERAPGFEEAKQIVLRDVIDPMIYALNNLQYLGEAWKLEQKPPPKPTAWEQKLRERLKRIFGV